MIRKYLFGFLIWLIYRLWSWTWRVEIYEPDSLKKNLLEKDPEKRIPMIFSHWHGDELVLVSLTRRYKIATITSTSKDGEMMNTVIHLLGGKTSRGSSTRGAVGALKGLMKLVKSGRNCSFAVDGPKGPIYKVKPGVFETSRVLKAVIYAAGVTCDRAIYFPKAWNKTYLPKPFAKIKIYWSGPMGPVDKSVDSRNTELALELENLLHGAKHQALNHFAAVDP